MGGETVNKSKHIKNYQFGSVFGDARLLGACAVAYAVIQQPSGIKQGLISSKSRLPKKQLTIPRLELVAA